METIHFCRWVTHAAIAAVMLDGRTTYRQLDGPVRRQLFMAFLLEILADLVRSGNVLVMDNLSGHKDGRLTRPWQRLS